MKSIIVDLDGTLCNTDHRDHLAQLGNWDAFHELIGEDSIHEDVAVLLDTFRGKAGIILLTARPVRYKSETEDWLRRHQVDHDALIMRANDDNSPSEEFKIKALLNWWGTREEVLERVLFCLEDRTKIAQAFRDYGLNCWQVREGSY